MNKKITLLFYFLLIEIIESERFSFALLRSLNFMFEKSKVLAGQSEQKSLKSKFIHQHQNI